MIACQALAMCALARMLDKPLLGSLLLGLALSGAFLTRGLPGLAPVLLAVPIALHPRSALWPVRKWLGASIVLAVVLVLAWWVPANRADPEWIGAWMHWNKLNFGLPQFPIALRPLRDLPWFLWPVWPLAGLALWQWRRWITAPHIWIPLSFALAPLLVLLIMEESGEPEYVLLVTPLSVLAAFALPTMRRAVINIIDWFALMCFSVTIACVWVGWFALHFGIPHQIQLNIERLTTGYEPQIAWWTVIVSALVTLLWITLVFWRLRRQPSVLWRGVMLCAAGITATWILLVLLWMPAVDYVRSYRPMSGAIHQALSLIPTKNGQQACVRAQGLSLGPRASLYVFDGLSFTYDSSCPYVLQQTTLEQLENGSAGYSDGAEVLWAGSRGADRYDRYRLLRVSTK
jgi:4-amino-4-deoxy-L-arabinose transferase-like glycosyltransferase